MASKRINQLSTISGVAASDLLVVYDVSDGTTEKTKSILYSDLEKQFDTLYYSGDEAVIATNRGADIYDSSGNSPQMYLRRSNGTINASMTATTTSFIIHNANNSALLRLQQDNYSGVNKDVFTGDGDGPAKLYYAGEEKLATTNSGVDITGDIHCNDLYTDGSSVHIGDTVLSDDSGVLEVNGSPLGSFTRKNVIINGNFNVWQRNNSFTGVLHEEPTADRWVYYKDGAMVHTVSRSTDVPTLTESGSKILYSLLMDCTTADTNIGVDDLCMIGNRIEGYDIQQLMSKTITISFWVKATKTGIYSVALNSTGDSRGYVDSYTVNSSDTWEKKTITLDMDDGTSGTWDFKYGVGLSVYFTLAAGTTQSPGSWSGTRYAATGQVNACDSTSNSFRLAQVQLEIGDNPTDFEYRTFSEELAMCQRYFTKSYNYLTYAGTSTSSNVIECISYSTDYGAACVKFPVEMRSGPSISIWSRTGVANSCSINGDNSVAANTGYVGTKGIGFIRSTSSEFTSGEWVEFHYYADSEL